MRRRKWRTRKPRTAIQPNGYRNALLSGLDGASDAAIDIAWIDKRPVAYLKDGETGAELSDMMLVIHEWSAYHHIRESRACLLEVKQSAEDPIKPVPVTSGPSTLNQFAILSNWPPLHGLKATGTNKKYLLENIDTKPFKTSTGAIPQAWYVAVKPKSKTGASVPDPWMAAPAVSGASFEHTLGDLFQAFARAKALTHKTVLDVNVGRPFTPTLSGRKPHSWDDLISQIIWVARKYNLPRHLPFASAGKRYREGRFRSTSSYLTFAGLNSAAWKPLMVGLAVGAYFGERDRRFRERDRFGGIGVARCRL